MRSDEAPILNVYDLKDAGRPRLTHHHRCWWNEMNWVRIVWRNGGNENFYRRGKRDKLRENLPRLCSVHHETNMNWQSLRTRDPRIGKPVWAIASPGGQIIYNRKGIPITGHSGPGHVDARVHIYRATVLEEVGWIVIRSAASTPGGSPWYSFYRRVSGPQDQSGYEGMKENLPPFRHIGIEPGVSSL